MQQQPEPLVNNDDEIDLRELWQHLMDGKQLIAAITAACFVLAFSYAVTATSWYKAEATLMDNSGGGSKTSGALGGLGGLAALAGVNMPVSPVEAVLASATSGAFLIEFVRKHELKKVLMKGAWDEESQQWKEPSGLVYTLWGQGLRPILMGERPKVNSPYPLAENEPTWQSLVSSIQKSGMFSISQDKKSNMITMSITWTDPNQAAQWVELWVNDLNDLIRQRTIEESQAMLDNLIPKLDQPMPAEVRASIIGMIDEQTKTINAAMVKKDYALKLISTPLASDVVVKPKRTIILFIGIFLGLIIGAMVAIIRGSRRKSSNILVPEGLQRERV